MDLRAIAAQSHVAPAPAPIPTFVDKQPAATLVSAAASSRLRTRVEYAGRGTREGTQQESKVVRLDVASGDYERPNQFDHLVCTTTPTGTCHGEKRFRVNNAAQEKCPDRATKGRGFAS